MGDFVNTGELFDPNKPHPCVFGRISFMKMFAYGKVINIGAYEGKMFGDKVTNVDLYDFGAPNLTIADAAKLPFKDKEFDCAVISEVLEHVDDPVAVLSEAMRVADSVALSVPNESEFAPFQKPFTCVGPGHEPTGPGHHVRFFDQEMLYDLFRQTRFQLVYFSKVNMNGWSELLAFGTTLSFNWIGHRAAGGGKDERKGQRLDLTTCETIGLMMRKKNK